VTALDCQACGACCVSPPENFLQGYDAYIAVEPKDTILGRPDLKKKLVVLREGQPHLRLDRDGLCLALLGAVGRRVSCSIYHHRPSPCRRVEAGSRLCHWYRQQQGLE
jgi:hypothetical protein